MFFSVAPNHIYATTVTLNNTEVQTKTLKVLTIRIDPMISKYNKRASEYVAQNISKNFLFRDYATLKNEYASLIEQMSHNNVDVEIVDEYILNEFPRYTKQITLSNGTKSYSANEATWLNAQRDNGYGTAGKSIMDFEGQFGLQFGDYDYNQVIDYYDLVTKRNNGVFDVVWLVGLNDCAYFESVIVGKTGYWDNGSSIYKNCPNFLIMALTLPRSETYLECLGHSTEFTMETLIYNRVYNTLPKVSTLEQFKNLKTWEQFCQYDKNSPSFSVAGIVHYAPNSSTDYDWCNSSYVRSFWKDFRDNYPNLTYGQTSTGLSDWYNSSAPIYANDTTWHNLEHKKWWFSVMPHVSGRDKDGFSNNWWDYIFGLDWVISLNGKSSTYTVKVGETLNTITYVLQYRSLKTQDYCLDKISKNTSIISGDEFLTVNSNNELVGQAVGTSTIRTFFDGKYVDLIVNVEASDPVDPPVPTEPTDPTEPVDPTEPDPSEPTDPIEEPPSNKTLLILILIGSGVIFVGLIFFNFKK